MTDKAAIQQAINDLSSDNHETRRGALILLGNAKDVSSIPRLINALRDKNKDVRLAAARALGKFGDTGEVSEILNAMRDVWISSARRLAAEMLAAHQGEGAIPGLIWLMHDDSLSVRHAAARSLQKLGWQPDTKENNAYYLFALRHWDALVQFPEEAVPIITEYLFAKIGTANVNVQPLVDVLHLIGTPPALAALEQWKTLNQSVVDITEKTASQEIITDEELIDFMRDEEDWVDAPEEKVDDRIIPTPKPVKIGEEKPVIEAMTAGEEIDDAPALFGGRSSVSTPPLIQPSTSGSTVPIMPFPAREVVIHEEKEIVQPDLPATEASKKEEAADGDIVSPDHFGGAVDKDKVTITDGLFPETEKPITPTTTKADVQFSAYYPREVQPNEWQPLYAYAFQASAAGVVFGDAEKLLGSRIAQFRQVSQVALLPIPEGELLTITPYLPMCQCNPPSITFGFFEEWHRLEFKIRTKTAPLFQSVNGFLTFALDGVVVADIPLSIFVTDKPQASPLQPMPAVSPYSAVFASYSHRDSLVVEQVERACKALGMDYLRDVMTLKSGQDWDDMLLQLIEKADIFQLFWSEAAAKSLFVEKEWRHALEILTQRAAFIRPVYWQKPLATVPNDLMHLHFAYQPDLLR